MSRKARKKERPERGALTGELHMARNGAGYLVDPASGEAVWIEAKDLSTALPGDTVTVRPGRDGAGGLAEFRRGRCDLLHGRPAG